MGLVVSYFIFLINIAIIKATSKYYDVQQNTNVNSNFALSQLIKSFKKLSKITCLVECNLDYVSYGLSY